MGRFDALADLLYEFSRSVSRLWKDVFRENDLAPAPLLILRQVHREPGLTVSELARKTETAKSHVSRTIDILNRKRYVEKRSDPQDQRVVRIYPTLVVSTGLDPLRTEIKRRLTERLETLTEGQVAELSRALLILQTVFQPQTQASRSAAGPENDAVVSERGSGPQ